ncbi:MAG: porin, partial [Gammaproteobacteria bacterium]
MMKKSFVAVAVAGALSVPAAANAADVLGKNLQIYGKVHLSLDSVDNGADKNLSLASNSSRLGFKGQYDVSDSLQGIWQIESKVVYDNGGKSAFVGRNTFAGLKGGFGTIAAGYKDTPFKDIRWCSASTNPSSTSPIEA